MIHRFFVPALALSLALSACGSDANKAAGAAVNGDSSAVKTSEQVQSSSQVSNSDLTNNPATANTPLKEDEAAKIEFINAKDNTHDFGTIKQTQKVEHVFEFKNTGKAPLVITNAQGSCGCTAPEYTKDPIAPGATGKMKVSFDPTGKEGAQTKYVTITANTIGETRLTIKANVQK